MINQNERTNERRPLKRQQHLFNKIASKSFWFQKLKLFFAYFHSSRDVLGFFFSILEKWEEKKTEEFQIKERRRTRKVFLGFSEGSRKNASLPLSLDSDRSFPLSQLLLPFFRGRCYTLVGLGPLPLPFVFLAHARCCSSCCRPQQRPRCLWRSRGRLRWLTAG